MTNFRSLLLLFFIAFTITSIWFRHGNLLATGEVGLVFYQIQNQASYFDATWSEGATGIPNLTGLSGIGFYSFFSLLSRLGIPGWVNQAIFFYLMLCVGLSGMYLLTKFIDQKPIHRSSWEIGPVGAALFYIANLIALVNVFNRFQYTFIIFYLTLPWVLLCFAKAIKTFQYSYLGVTIAVMTIGSYAYSSIPLSLLTWLILASYAFHYLITHFSMKQGYRVAGLFSITVIGWVIVNLWWIYPFITILRNTSYIGTIAYGSEGNTSTLNYISNKLGNVFNIVRLVNATFFEEIKTVWGNSYNWPVTILLSALPILLVISAFFIKKRNHNINYLLFMACVAVFFTKGTAPPFGNIFLFLFEHIRILEAFRNPFEKIGMIIPLFFAPLIGIVINRMYLQSAKVITVIALMTLCWPMWTGHVFMGSFPPQNNPQVGYQVQVPTYYNQADEFFKQQKGDFRVLAIPFNGEGITYTWPKGYAGVDVYNGMFNRPMISFSTNIQYYGELANQVQQLILTSPLQFLQFAQALNVRYILVRDDVDVVQRALIPPEQLRSALALIPHIKQAQQFGALSIYQFDESIPIEKVTTTNTLVTYPITEPTIYKHISPFVDQTISHPTFILEEQAAVTSQHVRQSVYAASMKYEEQALDQNITMPFKPSKISPENAELEIVHVKHLPGDLLYSVSRLKESFSDRINQSESQKPYSIARRAGKRLMEVYLLAQQKKAWENSAQEYGQLIKSIRTRSIYEREEIQQEFRRHQIIINKIQVIDADRFSQSSIKHIAEYISDLITNGIKLDSNVPYKFPIYQIKVPTAGEYIVIINTDEQHENVNYYSSDVLLNNEQHFSLIDGQKEYKIQLKAGINTLIFDEDQTRAMRQESLSSRFLITQTKYHQPVAALPIIHTTKISKTEYEVNVENATDPYLLNFTESFHPLWIATVDNQAITSEKHLLLNSYANGWYIEKAGNYKIRLTFAAEETYKNGTRYSVISGLALIIVSAICYRYQRKKIHEGSSEA